MKFIKINQRHINIEQIVTITNDGKFYQLRMSNGDLYRMEINKANKKMIDGVLNENIQLSSQRVAKRVD